MLKTVSSITNAIGALNFKGTWDASTNTPTIVSSVGVKGDYFVVSVAGSTSINGISNWGVGDWITYNGSIWQRVEGGADLNGVNLSVSGTSTLSGLTASTALALNASKEIVSVPAAPAFSAFQSVAQTLSSNTNTLTEFQTAEFDTNGCFNASSSSVTLNGLTAPAFSFVPNVAGYYQVNFAAQGGAAVTRISISIQKNGSTIKGLQDTSTALVSQASGSALIFLNGTGDYIQAFTFFSVGQIMQTTAPATWFQAAFVRGA
jgi:hypothetical protein